MGLGALGSLVDFLLCHFSGAAPCSGPTGKIFQSSTFVGPPLPLASISLQSNRVLLAQSLFLCSCWWAEGLQAGIASRDRFLTNLETPTFFFTTNCATSIPSNYTAVWWTRWEGWSVWKPRLYFLSLFSIESSLIWCTACLLECQKGYNSWGQKWSGVDWMA